MSTATLSKPVFKQFRKGTRSCQECRRRKVKCIFLRDEDSICEPCKKAQRLCRKQGYPVDGNLKARIFRAESTAERLGSSTEGAIRVEPFVSSASSATSTDKRSSRVDQNGPSNLVSFLQLFDAKPLTHEHATCVATPQLQTTVTFDDPNLSDREKLLSTISGEPRVLEIFESTDTWWTQWRDQGWTQRKQTSSLSLIDFVAKKLKNDHPASITVGLVCIAMSLFIFRPGIDDIDKVCLANSPEKLMQIILAVVDSVVLGTIKYDEHEDIILATMLRGKLYSEDSQARKGSQKLQQALRIMRKRRFGLPDQPGMRPEDIHSQQQFLGSVYEVERFMTMVFGFPYMPDPNFTDRLALQLLQHEPASVPLSLRMRAIRRVATIAAEHINDRNAKRLSDDTSMNDSIAQKLAVAYTAMPTEWWDSHAIAQGEEAEEAFEIILSQVWFWTTKMFLFLPAVLDNMSGNSQSSSKSYVQCLDAARNLIVAFEALRSKPEISVLVCNCDDFMGILAGSVLLVTLMQAVSNEPSGANHDTSLRFEYDMLLIERLKDIYSYRTQDQGSNIARQGLKVLETLSAFFDEPGPSPGSTGEFYSDNNAHQNSGMNSASTATTAVVLPYFGTIYVQSSRKLVKPRHGVRPSQSIPSPPDSLFNGLSTNENAFDMVDWDDWNQFLFDSELNKDWNYDLPDFDVFHGDQETYTPY